MKPTTEQIIDWGRTALNETGALIPAEWNMKLLEAICSAAYEAGRKDENEACAKVCEIGTGEPVQMKTLEILRQERERIAFVIRERGAP